MIEVRESSDELKGPFFLIDSAAEKVLMQGLRDRQLAEDIARDVNSQINSQKIFTPSKGSQRGRRRWYYDFVRLFDRR